MKVTDSGMPDKAYWDSLFDIESIIDWLKLTDHAGPIAEIGCGYGSFTVPIAQKTNAQIHAFDMEPAMLEAAQANVRKKNLSHVHFYLRDILEQGTGLESNSIGMVLLFNILHFDQKTIMLKESARVLKPGGIAAIIHWRKDIQTPRGPVIHSRPDKESILSAVSGLDLDYHGNSKILKPYHWGIQLIKGRSMTPAK
ncbi:MAG: class I SAM-dependent methyltransferase [Mariprofundaceae bacterium]